MSTAREDLLVSDVIRPRPPGLRPFSVGILALARELQLAIGGGVATAPSPQEQSREAVALAWLLDEAHSIAALKEGAARGRERFFAELVEPYEFALEPARLLMVQAEIARANRAVDAALFEVAPKPGSAAGPTPPGN
jgi:hypothetical protein